jgi:hypothetical protein
VADAFQFGFDVTGRRDITVCHMAEIQFHAGLEAPFQRHLIDAPGRFPAGFQRVVHAGEKVIRRVQMRAVMGADLDLFHRGVFAVRQLIDPDTHIFGHGGRGLMMIQILDLGQHVRRIASDAGLQRDGDIDQTAWHGWFPIFFRFGICRLRVEEAQCVCHSGTSVGPFNSKTLSGVM